MARLAAGSSACCASRASSRARTGSKRRLPPRRRELCADAKGIYAWLFELPVRVWEMDRLYPTEPDTRKRKNNARLQFSHESLNFGKLRLNARFQGRAVEPPFQGA